MLDVIVFIKSDGDNANPKHLTATVTSIEKTIGSVDYKYYFVLNSCQEKTVLDMIKSGLLDKGKILKIKNSVASWAYEYNLFFSSYRNETKYILVSHDDLVVKTEGFFDHYLELTKNKEDKIGWTTFTCDHYYQNLGKPWGVSARMGFAKDRKKWPYIYECHKFDASHLGKTKENLHLLDMPEPNKLVKVHAPWSVFNIISVSSMTKVGPCEDWTPYTMLIDEDWGLEALKNNLWNIWISDVFYTHPLNSSRSHVNRFEKEAHAKFTKKWGFDHGGNSPSAEQIRELKPDYQDTLFFWSLNYNTYDWQYL